MEPLPPQPKPPRQPNGIFSSRCDDKGRLRLPKEFEAFVKTFPDDEFFVTTFDGNIGRIYPISTWLDNEKVFERFTQNAQAAEDIRFYVDYYGAEASLDSQARILIPPVLRRKLGIENQQVFVRFYNGGIDIYSEAVSQVRLARGEEAVKTELAAMRAAGLK